MNPLALQSRGWSRRRLICTGVVLFAAQVILVLWFGQRPGSLPQRPSFSTVISLVPEGQPMEQFEKFIAPDDPTLFALPGLNGFSGSAWLQYPALDYQPPDYSEPLRWLEINEQSLGETFSSFLATNTLATPMIADKPLPPLQRYEPNYPNEPVPARSLLRIEGELAGRMLPGVPLLKSWPHSQLLSNTVAQVVASPDGMTLSATLLTGSGLTQADTYALKLAGNTRWRPVHRHDGRADLAESLAWGRMIFQWHTLPLPATSATAQP
jgi:hypothetical protein